METTLHRQLKLLHAPLADCEVSIQGYRIDAVVDKCLIEIQCGSLHALREKVRTLLKSHDVVVVKPLAVKKVLWTLSDPKKSKKTDLSAIRSSNPPELPESQFTTRLSPRHETVWDLFGDLVHFVDVFPHPRLTLQVVLTEQVELRQPRAKRRRRDKGYFVADRKLTSVVSTHNFQSAEDLLALLPSTLPATFTTADLATAAKIPRWLAQKAAYCLRRISAVTEVGRVGRAVAYRQKRRRRKTA